LLVCAAAFVPLLFLANHNHVDSAHPSCPLPHHHSSNRSSLSARGLEAVSHADHTTCHHHHTGTPHTAQPTNTFPKFKESGINPTTAVSLHDPILPPPPPPRSLRAPQWTAARVPDARLFLSVCVVCACSSCLCDRPHVCAFRCCVSITTCVPLNGNDVITTCVPLNGMVSLRHVCL